MGSNLSYHERLGIGACGEVLRVTWKSKEYGKIEAAAKKILTEGDIGDQVKREIGCLKKLNHRNIVRYYETIIQLPYVVILTEYAAKGSLYNYLKSKTKLPNNTLQQWINDLAKGIQYLHQENILHRDLKSPNCILTAADVLKICDFGISKELTSTKTTVSTKGSVKWQAPEIFREYILSPKADVFAFGIIVWEMIACDEPYRGMRSEHIIYKVGVDGLRPEIPTDCPTFLKELMEQCWHDNREKRPNSDEVVQRLRHQYLTESDDSSEKKLSDEKVQRPMTQNVTETDDYSEKKPRNEEEQRPTSQHVTETDDSSEKRPRNDGEVQRPTSQHVTETDGLKWNLKHEILSNGRLFFMYGDQLAICASNHIEVHHVTREETRLLYTLISDQFHGTDVRIRGVAVSESIPDSTLVICASKPYVYQFVSHWSEDCIKKDIGVYPQCIAANADVALIGLEHSNGFMVCKLPYFLHKRVVVCSFWIYNLCITTDYVLVMGLQEMVVKSLGDMDQDLCRIQPPSGWGFRSVSFENEARQIYAACYRENAKGRVYKYTWKGNGTPQYVNTGCVINNLGRVGKGALSVRADGLLAVANIYGDCSMIYCLE